MDFALQRIQIETYDGDTPKEARQGIYVLAKSEAIEGCVLGIRLTASIIITNFVGNVIIISIRLNLIY